MARWLDAGASLRLWMNNQPPGCVGCLLEPRRGLISWYHQGTARLLVADDAGSRGAPRCCLAALSVYDYPPGCLLLRMGTAAAVDE